MQSVHGGFYAFRHRHPRWPANVAGAIKLVPGICNKAVFESTFVFSGETKWLIWNHAQFSDDRTRRNGDGNEFVSRAARSVVAVTATTYVDQSCFVTDDVRFYDDEPVAPLGSINVGQGKKILRNELDDVLGEPATRNCLAKIVAIGGILFVDVFSERVFKS